MDILHFCFSCYVLHRDLHSFPTRRSSDLGNTAVYVYPLCILLVFLVLAAQYESFRLPLAIILIVPMCLMASGRRKLRSEEHTSELQSHSDLVCRLLLEKKKNTNYDI